MDDFNTNVLSEAKNEYSSRLINILSPLVIEGFRSILKEANDLCLRNNEDSKYLMTFQNFLTRVPRWNQEIINIETKRIIETSKCPYLEDLLTCVHITQLKVLTSIRVSTQQKKIDIDIPKLNNFVHKVYIEAARKIYQNVYLFENDIMPLIQQKYMRETEIIIKEAILNVIRSSMPIEKILRAYIDETEEEEVIEEIINKQVEEPSVDDKKDLDGEEKDKEKGEVIKVDKKEDLVDSSVDEPIITKENDTNINNEPVNEQFDNGIQDTLGAQGAQDAQDTQDTQDDIDKSQLSFNDNDNVVSFKKDESPDTIKDAASDLITAPKTIERLEQISDERHNKRMEEEDDEYGDDEEDGFKLKITDNISLDDLEIHDLSKKTESLKLNDIDELKGLDLLS
jgi:hypothetical protein